jgi:hypothetical protein
VGDSVVKGYEHNASLFPRNTRTLLTKKVKETLDNYIYILLFHM